MALKNIIGQEKALEILTGCIRKKRVPHALLFAGEEGIGKSLTAINFAKVLNCHNNRELFSDNSSHITHHDIDCCDECPSCKKIDKSTHPDVSFIVPEGKGKQIIVDSVRNLQESFSYRPFEGEWKIAIIDNADRLNQSASNAFLETLESPPAQSIVIIVSSRPDILLSTIRSRCQRINFTPLPLKIMGQLLEEKFKELDHDRAMLLGMLSGGKPGYALSEDLIEDRDRSFNELMEILGGTEQEVWEDRDAMERWFDWSQLWLRDIAVYKAAGRTDLLINQDRTAEIRDISQKADLKDILKLARELYGMRGLLNYNLNKQLTHNYTGLLLRKMLCSGSL